MITTVCFDVHAKDAAEIRRLAVERLGQFDDAFDYDRWTIHIEVTEEAAAIGGEVSMWRGEVTARRHDPT